jgi:hypothetical protein
LPWLFLRAAVFPQLLFLIYPDTAIHATLRSLRKLLGSMSVKIVLRDKQSGMYYRGQANWARNAYDALTFNNILEAEEFCRSQNLTGLQVIQQSGYFHRPLRYAQQRAATRD